CLMRYRSNRVLLTCTFLAILLSKFVLAQEKKARSWTPESNKRVMELLGKYEEALRKADEKLATQLCEELCRLDDAPTDHYTLACLYCRAGRLDDAIKKLRDSFAQAPNDPTTRLGDLLRNDEDLLPLRKRPEFAELVKMA